METKGDEWSSRPIAPLYNRPTYSQCPGITLYLHLCHYWHCTLLLKQVSGAKNLCEKKLPLKKLIIQFSLWLLRNNELFLNF